MEKLTEQESEIIHHSLSYWILQITVKFNLVWYVSEIIFNLISDLRSGDELITWQSILLGTSYNWSSFLNARIFMLVIGIVGAVAAWRLEPYWLRKGDGN